MIFISLPLYMQPVYNQYDYGAVPAWNPITGTAAAAARPPTVPQTEFILCNIAHIGCINTFNAQPDTCYVMVGNNSWQVAMSKERVIEEMRAAIGASGLPEEALILRPTPTMPATAEGTTT